MILHITTRKQWAKALLSGAYYHESLDSEGFIHCSKPGQILRSANERYRGRHDLLLLCLSVSAIQAPLIYEDSYNKGETFPHIYGLLNLDAVRHIVDFPPNNDGSFHLPEDIHDYCRSEINPQPSISEQKRYTK